MVSDNNALQLPALMRKDQTQGHSGKEPDNSQALCMYYKVGQQLHQLPPPAQIEARTDVQFCELESWPCNVGASNAKKFCTVLTKSNSLIVLEDKNINKYGRNGKPKLLDDIEKFLAQRISQHGGENQIDTFDNYEIYRQVFEYVIQKFPTYREFLLRIKDQYEDAFSKLQREIHQLSPLKDSVAKLTKEYEKKIEAIQLAEGPELIEAIKENKELEEKLHGLVKVEEDMNKQKEALIKEVTYSYANYREMADCCKMLQKNIRSLEEKHKDIDIEPDDPDGAEDTGSPEDERTLKIILKINQKSCQGIKASLMKARAEHSEVKPRRDLISLEKQYEWYKVKKIQLIKDIDQLRKAYYASKDENTKLAEEKNDLISQCQNLVQLTTNLPWLKPLEYITDDVEITKVGTTQLFKILEEMKTHGAKLNQTIVPFTGKGFGEDVPIYLRHEGSVYNRSISRRECRLLINTIWKARVQDPERDTQNLAEFLHKFLCKVYPIEAQRIELAYNLHDGCSYMAQWNDSINMFWRILQNEMEEDVYHSELSVISALLSFLRNFQETGDSDAFSRNEFQEALTEFFKPTLPRSVPDMVEAAIDELDDRNTFHYEQLFSEDDEGNFGMFLNQVRDHLRLERELFVGKVQSDIAGKHITRKALETIILKHEPEMNPVSAQLLLKWIYGTPEDPATAEKDSLEAPIILKRLATADIRCSVFKII